MMSETILAFLCIGAIIIVGVYLDYNRVKDTDEFKEILEDIKREDKLKWFKENR